MHSSKDTPEVVEKNGSGSLVLKSIFSYSVLSLLATLILFSLSLSYKAYAEASATKVELGAQYSDINAMVAKNAATVDGLTKVVEVNSVRLTTLEQARIKDSGDISTIRTITEGNKDTLARVEAKLDNHMTGKN